MENLLFVQRINTRLVVDVIRRVARYPGDMIYNTSSVFGSAWWSTTDKHANHRLRFLNILVVWVMGVCWKFVEATRVVSTGFLWKWDHQSTRTYHLRRNIDWPSVSRSRIYLLVRIRREKIQWWTDSQKSSLAYYRIREQKSPY